MGLLFSEEIKRAIECLLFVSAEPLSLDRLTELTGAEKETVYAILLEIQQYHLGRGFELVEIAGGWQFCTRPEFSGYIEKLYRPKMNLLSKAALETLAIVAYKQPVTRAEIEQIRGVKTDSVMGSLLEKGLIQDVGRKNGPGRPILYGTTGEFLRFFGLKDLDELPELENLAAGN